jgi:hypothetical protein
MREGARGTLGEGRVEASALAWANRPLIFNARPPSVPSSLRSHRRAQHVLLELHDGRDHVAQRGRVVRALRLGAQRGGERREALLERGALFFVVWGG